MFTTILIVVAVLVLAFLAYVVSRPNSFRIARRTMIQASPEKIHPFINDFHEWSKWSPFENIDPNLKKTFTGPASGVGAVYDWEGKDNRVGKGRMEITDTTPSKITIKLDFFRPFKAHNTAEYILDSRGSATEVTWAMSGKNSFMQKLLHTFMNMDKLLGKDFDKGLASLKALAEK